MNSRNVVLVATTELVSVERCFQFRLARRVGWPRSRVSEHHPTKTSRVVVGGGLGEGTRSGVEHGSTQTSCGVAGSNSEGPHKIRALIVDAGKVQANVNVLRPGPILGVLAVLLRKSPQMLLSMTVHRLAPTLVFPGEPSPFPSLCKTYYYARECQRVNGKPKIVRTVYLGAADELIAAATQQKQRLIPRPQSVDIAAFGDVVALYDLAQQIGLVELLDRHLPKRQQGLSVGQYLLLAAINRAVHPTSKRQLADWYRQTTLPRLIPATATQLSSQAFWSHLDFVEERHIEAVERELSQRLIAQFQLSLRTLTYDGTNFFTFVDTQTDSELLRRGHNKQKRNDLRQVSLGMLVSTDFQIPLFHKVYAGNVPDCTIFKTITEELRGRYTELARECEHITLVFDKGNNSEEAFETLDDSDFHFVGSLVPSHHLDLLDTTASVYQPLAGERLRDCRAYRTKRVVFGQERTIVVTHNDNLLHGQLQGLTAGLEKARTKLRELQHRLRRRREGRTRGGKAPTVASVRKQALDALAGQHLKDVLRIEVADGSVPTLTFETDQAALSRLLRTQLGKTILFTDNDDWSNEEIVLGYRSQHHIEDAFRQMKHPHYLGWSPMFHWTDSKIRVHAFTCVLALTLSSLLHRTLYHQGIDVSLPRMFELLGGIRETLVIYPRKQGQRQPSTARALSTLNEEQEHILTALNLRRYL